MASSHLLQFISLLEDNGDLSRISVPVDPVLEIAAITALLDRIPEFAVKSLDSQIAALILRRRKEYGVA